MLDISSSETVGLMVANCLYALGLNYNLISILKLQERDVSVYLYLDITSELVYREEIIEYTDILKKQFIL